MGFLLKKELSHRNILLNVSEQMLSYGTRTKFWGASQGIF